MEKKKTIGYSETEQRQGPYHEFINKYVIIYPQGINTTFCGKLVGIEEGIGVLNPFVTSEWNPDDTSRKFMKKGRSKVSLFHATIEPTTRKSLENCCISHNTSEIRKNVERFQTTKINRN